MAWLFLLIRKGNQVLLIIGKESLSFLSRINVRVFQVYALTFQVPITKSCMLFCLLNNSEASLTNSVNAGQPVPIGAV